MKSTDRGSVVGTLFLLLVACTNWGCGGGSASTLQLPPDISVSLSKTAFTVPPQATTQFTATVSNDPSGQGVTWSMTCNGATCGSVSPKATASGVPMAYTAPGAPAVTLIVNLIATSVADTTKSASVTITVPTTLVPIIVSVSPQSASVPSGGAQQFTATVANDPNNAGVTWQVLAQLNCNGISIIGIGKCNPAGEAPVIFLPCSGCGTVSPDNTASGAPTTYAASAHLTPPSQAGYYFGGALAIVATSVTNTSASAGAYPIVVLPISVLVSPDWASVALNGTQQFTATVNNDGTNSGVNWSLMQAGVACAPACGTITARTSNGAPATYSAPAAAPVSPLVTVTATSVEDAAASGSAILMLTTSTGALACGIGSGSEFLLKGQYAFLLQGDLVNFGGGAAVGSITADGTGKITGGEEDLIGPETVSIDTTASLYAVGPDHRGCLVLKSSTSSLASSFWFTLGSINSSSIATAGHVVSTMNDMIVHVQTPLVNETHLVQQPNAAGILRLQDPTSFTAGQFNGNYVVGFIGSDQQLLQNGSRRVAITGTLEADGVSAIPSATFDINDVGTVTNNLSSAPGGTFTCCDSNGRGTLTLGSLRAPYMGFYVLNSGDAFLIANNNNRDAVQGVGEAIGIPSGTAFTQASLNGASVLRETAQSSGGLVVDIATVSADGKGAMTVNDNTNNAGTFSSSSTALNYIVASNGRVTITGSSTPPVIYLYGQNQGFLVGTDPDVTFGILEPQAPGPFSNASFSGAYMFGTENPTASTVTLESGVITSDGKGNAAGTVDQSSPTGLTQNQALSFTYSISANGTGNVGSGTTAILISGNKLVFINNTSSNPTITVVEQ